MTELKIGAKFKAQDGTTYCSCTGNLYRVAAHSNKDFTIIGINDDTVTTRFSSVPDSKATRFEFFKEDVEPLLIKEPRVIKFDAGQLPKPETKAPKNGTDYFHVNIVHNEVGTETWSSQNFDWNKLSSGNVFLKEADAVMWLDFMNQ